MELDTLNTHEFSDFSWVSFYDSENIDSRILRWSLRGQSGLFTFVEETPTTQLIGSLKTLDVYAFTVPYIDTPWTGIRAYQSDDPIGLFEPIQYECLTGVHRFYYDEKSLHKSIRANLNLIRNLGNLKMSENKTLTNVTTYQSLLQARVLTGVLRIVDHHLVNGFSTDYNFRKLVTRGNVKADLTGIRSLLKELGFLVEARSYDELGKTGSYIAYLIKSMVTINSPETPIDVVVSAVKIDIAETSIEFKAFDLEGHSEASDSILVHLRQFEVEDPIKINYVCGFNQDGSPDVVVREVDPNFNKPLDIFYPYIEEGISTLSTTFAESTNNLLLMVGPPGTGKTSLLREFTRHFKDRDIYQFCGDKVILHPSFDSYLAKLPKESLIIIEDADSIIGKRTEGNTTMSMLLNEIDGITTTGSKFIITTNLESLKSVDEGLLRPGRCFATKEFRALSYGETKAIVDAMALPAERVGENKVLSRVLGGDGDHITIIKPGFSLN